MLSRRRFVLASSLMLTSGALVWPVASRAAIRGLSATQRRWLLATLSPVDRKFDPFAKLLVTSAADGPAYHTTLRTGDVHAISPSLHYAAALLDAGEKWRAERAREIIRVAISLQDQDPASRTYGLWPWYLEEALDRMAPPDPASAGRCATALLMIQMAHSNQLEKALREAIRAAVVHAARSIERHPVIPEETHTTIQDAGVALLTAQEFKLADLRTHARERLRKIYDYILGQGSFAEYNSPTDTITTLRELSRILWLVKDGRDRTLATAIHELAWKHAATHFHPPTRQWAGPHSRVEETDLRSLPKTLAFLQTACEERADFGLGDPLPLSLEACRIPLRCPRQFVKYFARLDAPRQVIETFAKANRQPGSQNPIIGTTWLHPRYTLGSINRGDLWRERRPLLAYWGTPASPRYLRVRFLKDDRDFSSALFFSVQHEGTVSAAVVFATDHGDSHPRFDPIRDGTIRTRDLRLRFELGGTAEGLTVQTTGAEQKHLVIQDRDVRWVIRPVADAFAGGRFAWDYPELKVTNRIDAVAYQGAEKSFKLAEIGEAFVCFTMEEWSYDEKRLPELNLVTQRTEGRFHARCAARGRTLDLNVPTQPGPSSALVDSFRGVRA